MYAEDMEKHDGKGVRGNGVAKGGKPGREAVRMGCKRVRGSSTELRGT